MASIWDEDLQRYSRASPFPIHLAIRCGKIRLFVCIARVALARCRASYAVHGRNRLGTIANHGAAPCPRGEPVDCTRRLERTSRIHRQQVRHIFESSPVDADSPFASSPTNRTFERKNYRKPSSVVQKANARLQITFPRLHSALIGTKRRMHSTNLRRR